MTPEEAKAFADRWRAEREAGGSSVSLAKKLGVWAPTVKKWRRIAEQLLGISLPSMQSAGGKKGSAILRRLVAADSAQDDTRDGVTRHYMVPDLQVGPGVPLDHLDWIAQDIVRRKPDVIVQIGDWADFHSLSMHDAPGSLAKEGARYEEDVEAVNASIERLTKPIRDAMSATWKPRLVFTRGNHEDRVRRAIDADPRWAGTIRDDDLSLERWGWEVHPFLRVVEIGGVSYAHYFQNANNPRPIGGSMDNRLNKIGASFMCGHEQGLLLHRRPLPIGRTIHAVVCGSCYLHSEDYRGAQRNNEWRGVVIANDVRNGDFEPMPLTLRYLCRKYTGMELVEYMQANYPDGDWRHLRG